MSDTQKRIAEYKKLLPGLKERVVAVALLLVISLTMVTTTTLAWIVLSISPGVTGITTSIASNGNLEIALANPDGSAPDESKVGDSFATKGQGLTSANLTWGNLINLSDAAYGLENLVLRPAKLESSTLLTNPLRGASYDSDGRMNGYIHTFGYTKWVPPEGDVEGYFGVSGDYGVRAISSVTVEAVGAAATWRKMLETIEDSHMKAQEGYQLMATDDVNKNVLAVVIGTHMTATLNPGDAPKYSDPVIDPGEMVNLLAMYDDIIAVYQTEAQTIADILNAYLFLEFGADNYVEYTASEIFTLTDEQIKQKSQTLSTGVISGIASFQTYYQKICEGRDQINDIIEKSNSEQGEIRWKTSGMMEVIKGLVNIDNCLITYNGETKTVKNFLSGVSSSPTSYLGLLGNGASVNVEITNGVLYQLELQLGEYIDIKNLKVSASMYVNTMNLGEQNITVKTNAITSAKNSGQSYYSGDKVNLEKKNTGDYEGGVQVADDTYALVVDFWIRTNAANSYLTLAGNVLTHTEIVNATTRDPSGTEVIVYTLTVVIQEDEEAAGEAAGDEAAGGEEGGDGAAGGEEGGGADSSENTTVYELYKSSNGTWYNARTHNEFTFPEGYTEDDAIQKMVEVTIIDGYEGDNRVWEGNTLISSDASTQGSGSCYVFYYNAPEDREKTLAILSSMRVAFVDDQGNLLTEAYMDTERFYDDNGRVIVPMALESTVTVPGNNGDIPVITYLERNQAMRITAIVYLDGLHIDNSQVLSAASIQGQVNLQFSSTAEMLPMEDEDLQNSTVSVEAKADQVYFEYEGDPITSRIQATIEGITPSKVEAFFVRSINSMQATKEYVASFAKQGATWVTDYVFNSPGEYMLRSLRVDGIEYPLKEVVTVTVEGFVVSHINWGEMTNALIFTSDSTYTTNMSIGFKANKVEAMPNSVRAVFKNLDDGSSTSAPMTYNPVNQEWSGDVTFYSSGTYELMYLAMDGAYQPVSEGMKKYAEVSLGISVAVYTDDKHEFKYAPDEMAEGGYDYLDMKVRIFDDRGQEIQNLDNARLTYRMRGSTQTHRMEALLSYESSSRFYVCEYNAVEAGPGIWEFVYVTVGNSEVTRASTAPTFRALSPEPPVYVSSTHATNDGAYTFLYTGNNKAMVQVVLKYTAAADVYAVFRNEDGVLKEVAGVSSPLMDVSETQWTFNVPKNDKDTQDGTWELIAIKLGNVFDANGKLYSYDPQNDINDPYEMDVTDKKIGIRVLDQINIVFVDENGATKKTNETILGKTDGQITATFMAEQTMAPIYLKITDYKGNNPLDGNGNPMVETVTLAITYKLYTSRTYGGYFNDDLDKGNVVVDPLSFTYIGNGIWKADGTKLTVAGEYTTVLSVSGDSMSKTEANGTPTFKVYSVTPTVQIQSISSTGTFDVDASGVGSGHQSATVPAFTATSATVYFKCSRSGSGSTCDPYRHNYSRPSVAIQLAGIGRASGASLDFGNDVQIYNGTTQTTGYSWTADGTCSRNIGYYRSRTASNDDKAPAGTLTSSTLILTYNNDDYTVTIPTITINNPY